MKRSREEVLRIVSENLETIRGYGVRRLGLFGSCARGEASPSSDLDFVVEFERKSFDAYMDLKAYLEQLFNCAVDLVLADTLKPRLCTTVLRKAVHAPGL